MQTVTRPSRADSQISHARWESLTPELLSSVLARLHRGELRDWSDLCDRMLLRDTQILATYETRLSVISASDIVVERPALTGDSAIDAASTVATALVEHALSRITSLPRHVHESLDAIGRGVAVHEIEWGDVDGADLPVALHWLHTRRFAYDRDWQLCLSDRGGKYQPERPGTPLSKWPDRFLTHEPRTVPGYPNGGVFRPVSWMFLFKAWCQSFWLQGAESFAWPLRIAKVPRGADAGVREAAREFLDTLSVNHSAVVEGETALEYVESTVKDGGTWRELVQACDAAISTAILGMTDLTSPTRIGAYAAVETRKGATVDARIAKDERALATSWTDGLVRPIVERNTHLWGGIDVPLPRIRWAIPSSEREIPAHVVPYVTVDELRASIGLAPLPGGAGQRLVGDAQSAS